jgi:hypothetical protein
VGLGDTNDRLRPNGHECNPCQVPYIKLILFIFSSHYDNIFHIMTIFFMKDGDKLGWISG